MAIRWNCSACALPMMNKSEEAGLVSVCPRCRHEELVPETSTRTEREDDATRNMTVEMTWGERIFVNVGVWGLVLLVIATIAAGFWLTNFNFSAPDMMIEDGIGTYGSEHLKK